MADTVSTCHCSKSIDLASAIEAIPYPALILDRNHSILTGNQAYLKRYADRLPVCGRKCYDVSHGIDSPCDENGESCPLRACADSRHPVTSVHMHQSTRGPERIAVSIFPLFNSRGGITAFLETLRPLSLPRSPDPHAEMVGSARVFQEALEILRRAARTDISVLLVGESGTGKELLAEYLHRLSDRRNGNFVAVDCSALSPSLFESELFGHKKGAFTGATIEKPGLVEKANGGTLFLDEVGDVPNSLQMKLLRLLETHTFRRVGCTQQREGNFRLVCATNRPLSNMVASGAFRSDLYYRISAFPVPVPPLRERREDLPLLIEHFRKQFDCGERCRFQVETLGLLGTYDFPGNIRELRNIVQRACLLADDELIDSQHLPEEIRERCSGDLLHNRSRHVMQLREHEDRYILSTEERFGANKAKLAAMLGISERTLFRKLRAARQRQRPQSGIGTSDCPDPR